MKKMQKVISMVLVFVLILCMCPFAAAEDTSSDAESGAGFHAPTIRKMIDVNLECDNADEEFFHLLANAYLADPELLIETIMDLPEEDIVYLAKAIAYDLQKTQRQDAVQTNFADPATDIVGRLIALETADTENASLDVFLDEDMLTDAVTGEMPDADLMVLEELAGAMLTLASNTADVASPVTATISFGSTLASPTLRRYTVKFYKIKDNVTMYCGTTKPFMSPNTMTTTATAQLSFGETGVYQVYAEIYNSAGEHFGTSPSVTVTVWGQWHITVELTEDRTQLGTITLYNASGTEESHSICLGRSAKNLKMKQTDGHTPIGIYTGYLDDHDDDNIVYGPYKVIKMQGQSGYVVDRCSHRTGIWIHGGREGYNSDEGDSSYPLYYTNGCVRITNTYQLQLQDEITDLVDNLHYTVGIITITQDGQTTLTEE